MRIRDEHGLILESHNDLVMEQWKKAGFKDIDEEEAKPEEVQEVKPAEEEKPKRKRKSAE